MAFEDAQYDWSHISLHAFYRLLAFLCPSGRPGPCPAGTIGVRGFGGGAEHHATRCAGIRTSTPVPGVSLVTANPSIEGRASERLLPASGPWKGVSGLVKPARKVVGRGTRRRVAQHAVRKPASQVGTGSIGFRQNSGQSPDGAEGSRKALWFSEGIRPLPMRRNPKRRFRPTRALGLVLRRGRHPLRHREVGQKRLGGAPPPPATPSCAVAGRCAYNLWISDINIRARMVRGRAPDTDARPIPAT